MEFRVGENKMNILLAEDEYMSLIGLKESIKELGHDVIAEATDGKEAIELALEKKPKLIIMDINMPIISGLEAIKKINKETCIPIIIVSGYYEDDLIDEAKKLGVFEYLVKPITSHDLKVAIEITTARFEEFKKVEEELNDTKEALEARKYIEKAKGILMKKKDLDEPEAMKMLQKKSRDNNKKISEMAKEIINVSELLD